MKRIFFLLLAAALIGSMSVNAQTGKTAKKVGSSTSLKGDVNGDGVVDVADIAAIIAIIKNNEGTSSNTKYYWYVGTNSSENAVTASNYTSIASLVKTIPSSVDVTLGNNWVYIYVVAPKAYNIRVVGSGGYGLEIIMDETEVGDYKIYCSARRGSGGDIRVYVD